MLESPVEKEIVEDIKNSSPDCLQQNENMGSQQEMPESQSQTQNELTQLFEETGESSTPLPIAASPLVAVNPRSIPWGRIIRLSDNHNKLSDSSSGMGVELLPRDPIDLNLSSMRTTRSKSLSLSLSSPTSNQQLTDEKIVFLGISNLKPSDRFNEYTLGRSTKCDIVASKLPLQPTRSYKDHGQHDETKQKNQWVHSMISNKHCNLFCLLKQSSSSVSNNNIDMEVYIQDTSGNGTLINQSTILHRGERRLLHTGDEICLINPATLRRRIRSIREQKEILTHYSFIFVNLYQTQRQHQNDHQTDLYYPIHDTNEQSACQPENKKIEQTRKGMVDAHTTNSNSQTRFNVDSTDNNMPPPNNVKTSPRNILIASSKTSSSSTTTTTNESSRRLEKYYDLRDVLGSGTCGEVRRAIHHKTGLQVAVKIIPIDERNQSRKALLGRYNQIHAEASILKSLNHPYIVQLLDVFYHPGKAIYLVMELLGGGDLFDRIVEKSRYSEMDSRRIMRRLLSAVFYLHEECDIVHRDLKPENILCVSRTNDIFVKLSDFGLAKSITEDGLKTFCGTPQYFAPEVLKRRNTIAGIGRYGKEADMWSLGIILYILLCGAPPFDSSLGLDAVAQAKIRFSGTLWKGISKEAIDLIRKLLVVDPSKRIDVVSACKHVWILTEDGDSHISPLNDPLVIEHRKKASKKERAPSETFSNKAESKSISNNGNHQQVAVSKDLLKPFPDTTKNKLSPPSVRNDNQTIRTPSAPQSNMNSPEPQCQNNFKNPEGESPQNKSKEKNHINSNHIKQHTVEDNKYVATPTNFKSEAKKTGLVISSLLSSDESARFPTPKTEYIPTNGTNHHSHKQSLFSTVKQRSEEGKSSVQENKHTKDNLAKTKLSSEFNFIEVKGAQMSDEYGTESAKKNGTENKKFIGELSDDEIKSDFSDDCDEKENDIKSSGLVSNDKKMSLDNQPHDSVPSKSFLPKYSQLPSDSKKTGAIACHDNVSPKHLRSMKQDLSAVLQEEDKTHLEASPIVEKAMNSSLDDVDSYPGLKNEYGKERNTTKSKQKKRVTQEQSSESNKKSLKTSHGETLAGSKGKQTTLSNWFKKK